MSNGYINFVLHAHLPFVRHPEYPRFLEENWLFEAISETYLPLLRVLRGLQADEVPFRLTLSVSPTLASMLGDELLLERYASHLERGLELAAKEVERLRDDESLLPVARMYGELFEANRADFEDLYERKLLKAFRQLERDGVVELITTAATHAYLPLYQTHPQSVEAQVQTAVISHSRSFGRSPDGFWLPECGYFPGLEDVLKADGIKYFFTAAHGILHADQLSPYGVYAPVRTSNGVAAFGRDIPSSQLVWSAKTGYPGDPAYREFYRDIGFDLPLDYIGPYVHEDGVRVNTGFKYYAVTGHTEDKIPYDPAAAREKVKEHARNFIYHQRNLVKELASLMDRPPLVTCPYDAELFGHWWFEGPQWIDQLIRGLAEAEEFEMVTGSDYLTRYPDNPGAKLSYSSWGNKGYSEVWLDGSNDWIYRHVHKAIERMSELVSRFPDEAGLKRRVLNQAAREVMLAQASDWPFIMKTGTTVPYAVKRVKEHLANFNLIYENLCRNTVNTEWLTRMERKNNLFPDLDYRMFKK